MAPKVTIYWDIVKSTRKSLTFRFGRKPDLSDSATLTVSIENHSSEEFQSKIVSGIYKLTGKKHFNLKRVSL